MRLGTTRPTRPSSLLDLPIDEMLAYDKLCTGS